jgi:hypothetical protein
MNITELVIEDIKKRADVGLEKYGRHLTAFNGRSALQDLYEELLDASQYIKQQIVEDEQRKTSLTHAKSRCLKMIEEIDDKSMKDYVNGYLACLNDLTDGD